MALRKLLDIIGTPPLKEFYQDPCSILDLVRDSWEKFILKTCQSLKKEGGAGRCKKVHLALGQADCSSSGSESSKGRGPNGHSYVESMVLLQHLDATIWHGGASPAPAQALMGPITVEEVARWVSKCECWCCVSTSFYLQCWVSTWIHPYTYRWPKIIRYTLYGAAQVRRGTSFFAVFFTTWHFFSATTLLNQIRA